MTEYDRGSCALYLADSREWLKTLYLDQKTLFVLVTWK